LATDLNGEKERATIDRDARHLGDGAGDVADMVQGVEYG